MSEPMTVALRFWQLAEAQAEDQSEAQAADLLHECIEVHDFDLPDAGIYHGHAGFARWLADWGEPWEEFSGEIHDLLDLDRQVASFMHLRARTAGGLEVDREDSQLVTVEGGKIVKLEYFGRPEGALEHCSEPLRALERKRAHDQILGFNDAFLRRDIEAAVGFVADDYEFFPEADSPLAMNDYRGHEGVRRYMEHAFEVWEEIGIRIERLVDAGDRVVALYDLNARARGSGIELSAPWAELWHTPGGRIASSRVYTSHEEALQAAGLT